MGSIAISRCVENMRDHIFICTPKRGGASAIERTCTQTGSGQGYQFLFLKAYPQFCTTPFKAPSPMDFITFSHSVTSGESSDEIPKPTGINPKVSRYILHMCVCWLCHLFLTLQKSCFPFLKLVTPDVTLHMHLFIMSKAYLEILIFEANLIGVFWLLLLISHFGR